MPASPNQQQQPVDEIELAEAAALRVQAREQEAEREFDRVVALAHERGDPDAALATPEFKAWMSARHASDAAWGRWFEAMGARAAND